MNSIDRILMLKISEVSLVLKVLSITFVIILSASLFLVKREEEDEFLKFSNSQEWGLEFYNQSHKQFEILDEASFESINLVPPPLNTSQATKDEVEYLLKLQKERSDEDIAFINSSLSLWQFKFADHSVYQFEELWGETYRLLTMINHDVGVIIFRMKKKFDRVRPSFLEEKLRPSIEIPLHPAYPSGHSTQAYVYAIILAKLDEKNKEKYYKSAHAIAKAREIAGVHYPSDTCSGQLLAEQIVNLLFKNKKFITQFEKSKREYLLLKL